MTGKNKTLYAFQSLAHRNRNIHIERATMHCKDIAWSRSFYIGLISAEGRKIECFKCHFIGIVKICSEFMLVFYLTQALYFVYSVISMTGTNPLK
jgi:hypothetical protein